MTVRLDMVRRRLAIASLLVDACNGVDGDGFVKCPDGESRPVLQALEWAAGEARHAAEETLDEARAVDGVPQAHLWEPPGT